MKENKDPNNFVFKSTFVGRYFSIVDGEIVFNDNEPKEEDDNATTDQRTDG
jgi:hypothetical protein